MTRYGRRGRAVGGGAVLVLIILAAGGCGDSGVDGDGATPSRTVAGGGPSATVVVTATVPATVEVATADVGTVLPETPGGGTPVAAPSATPMPPMDPSEVRLKYEIFGRFGELWWCDPDYYPVPFEDEQVLAERRFPEIEQDAPTLAAIVAHLGLSASDGYAADEKLAVYREWKVLRALELTRVGAAYEFEARFTHDEQTGVLVTGTIEEDGRIAIISEEASEPPMCPICLARGTMIATPDGPIPVEELRPGMTVWTVGEDGTRVRAEVIGVARTPVPGSHRVTHLVLADGQSLRASPGHPLADGRLLGEIAAGDMVDGSMVVSARTESYDGEATFDLLPSGPTGTYWADGVLVGSTLTVGTAP